MFVDRFREQIQRAENRYHASRAQRRERREQISKFEAGLISEINVSKLDDQSRLSQRMLLSPFERDLAHLGEATSGMPFADRRLGLLERIIESNDLVSSDFLAMGERARRTVGRVIIRSSSGNVLGYGTGSMVSSRLMMTNNHVLDSAATASNSNIQFDFVELFSGGHMPTVKFALEPSTFFVTDEDLDFTLVAVASSNANGNQLHDRGSIPLIAESGKAIVGERVNVIQHPGGRAQKVAIRQNKIVDVVDDFLHYEADTERGSSGSPVANDFWQTAALHHAGVPKRDASGRILLLTGQPWDGSQSQIGDIHWIANEGARVSRIADFLNSIVDNLDAEQAEMLSKVFTSFANTNENDRTKNPSNSGLTHQTRIDEEGRAVYTIPIEVTIGVGGAKNANPIAIDARPIATPTQVNQRQTDFSDYDKAFAVLKSKESSAYYDALEDQTDIDSYYTGIAERVDLVGSELYRALNRLLINSHTTVLSYRSARLEHLYPWVDLRTNRTLRSIYSDEGFEPEEVIRRDIEIEARREALLANFARNESSLDSEAMTVFLERLEVLAPFNCEHVVPQSWFGKKQPMKADLHHLFTCESDCNSFRSNIPYFEFPIEEEVVREKCGRREENSRFEPTAGKGAVARATLYFLIRYKGLIGDVERELQMERLPVLLKWHNENPVDEYERHRNAAIFAVQGNRNPLIDFPEWAEHIDFNVGFGRV